jgi:hypothetical protein
MKFKELREKYRSKFKPSDIAKAVEIALSMGGNMTGAYKKIESIKKGLGDDPVVKDALRTANESVKEGTMAIGVKDRDPNKREKAIDGMRKLVKSIKGSTKVGSPQGQKFAAELDMKYLSDDELADDFADPKNKNKSIKDIMNKHAKRLNIKFN